MATPASYLFLTNELVALLTAEQKSNASQLADNLRLVTKIIYNRVKSQSFIESVQLLRLKKLFISFEILKLHRSVRFFSELESGKERGPSNPDNVYGIFVSLAPKFEFCCKF